MLKQRSCLAALLLSAFVLLTPVNSLAQTLVGKPAAPQFSRVCFDQLQNVETPETVRDFWRKAWGEELVLGEKGMVLQATSHPEIFDLLLGNTTSGLYEQRATFYENGSARSKIEPAYQHPHSALFVVAGEVAAPTGDKIPVVASLQVFDHLGEKIRTLSVLEVGESLAAVPALAQKYASILSGELDDDPNGLELGSKSSRECHDCANAFEQQRLICQLLWKDLCQAGVASALAGCIAACASSGPALPICLAGCQSVAAGATAGCLAGYASCTNDARAVRRACQRDHCFGI